MTDLKRVIVMCSTVRVSGIEYLGKVSDSFEYRSLTFNY